MKYLTNSCYATAKDQKNTVLNEKKYNKNRYAKNY